MINKIPMYKFLSWFSFFIFICFIGIFKVCALTNNNTIKFYDNAGSSLTAKTTDYNTNNDESSAIFTTTANSYGGAVIFQLSSPLIQNHIYSVFLNVGAANMGGYTVPSSKNCVGIGTNYNNAINSYVNCSITPKYTQSSGQSTDFGKGLYLTFIANSNAAYLLIPYTSQNTCYDCYQFSHGYNITDGGDTNGLTQEQVNNLISQQTISIQNDIISMQSNINNSITQSTQQQIDSQKVCSSSTINNSSIGTDNSYLYNGTVTGNSPSTFITPFYEIDDDSKIFITGSTNFYTQMCFYDDTKTVTSCITYNTLTSNSFLTIPNNSTSFRATIYKQSNAPNFILTSCKNGNQAITDSVDNLTNAITDDSPTDVSSLGNTVGWLPSGPIDSIINLPLNFFNTLTNALSGTCSPLNINIPFINTTAEIPCLSSIFSQINGLTTFWNWVGRIASIYILYRYLIALWVYYDRLTTMQVNFRDDFGGGV